MRQLFLVSAFFLTAAAGTAVGLAIATYEIWPWQYVNSIQKAARSLLTHGEIMPEGRRIVAPAYASRERFTFHDPQSMAGGYYAFVGWDDARGRYTAWLFSPKGEELHSWSLDHGALDSGKLYVEDDSPHGFELLADGSVIVVFDRSQLLARLDACSRPVWKKQGAYHHLFSRADDGSLWVWRGDGTAYGHYQYMTNFDPETGDKLAEVALVQDLIQRMGPSAKVFGLRPDFDFTRFDELPEDRDEADLFHPNDVEVLSAELAPMFPMFEAGDLLISIRRLNLVAVVDPDDRRLKWSSQGPWLSQHDPDFTADGKISVYDNNIYRGRSEILKMDPATREVTNELFDGEAIFYSAYMGQHQYLPNGNVLIVVPGEGRILEVTSTGDNVMEFNNLARGAPGYNDHVENAVWVPADYFREVPACAGQAK